MLQTIFVMAYPAPLTGNGLMFLTFTVLCGAMLFTATADDSLFSVYEKWMADFGRVYKSDTEKQHRFEVFKANHQFIESMKSRTDLTYTVGLN